MHHQELLFCDTDCLVQLFISNKISILQWLRENYGCAAVIVPEVEIELSWHAKFKDRFEPALRKAVSSGILEVFEYSRPEQLSAFFHILHAAAAASVAIETTGRAYALKIGDGEAYSHSACIHLGMPLLSHDKSAINTLLLDNRQTAAPVLRVFDLLALAYQKGVLSLKDCDSVRQVLDRSGEFIPKVFKHASFEQGIKTFDARLHELPAGASRPTPCRSFSDPFYLDPA